MRGNPGARFWIVSNDVGGGVVPDNAMARRFQRLQGDANQTLAAAADRVALVHGGPAAMAEVTRLWLVRHGPTHAKTLIGRTDRPANLSDGPALARLSAALPPDAPVVDSDMARTRDTAAAIAGDRPRLPPDPAFREFDYGEWEDPALRHVRRPPVAGLLRDAGRRAPAWAAAETERARLSARS